MTPRPGQQLLHYRIVEEIGRGAMGTVWRAEDTTLDRHVALKVLPDALAADPSLRARFEREAKLLASLNHPNLAAVYGVHDVGSTRFLAMELVPGEDLSTRLARGPLAVNEALPIACRIAEAVEAAHDNGVIHRDLKPANVRLMPGERVKVLDFGLAKTVTAAGDGAPGGADLLETTAGVVLGTAPYMSPEQVRGMSIDARSDIWSFGCVLWECLTGRRPFSGEAMPDVVVAILQQEPDWTLLPPDTPRGVRRVLRRCLAKDPKHRLHHIADARIEIQAAQSEQPADDVQAEGARAPRTPGRRTSTTARLTALAALMALGLVLVLRGAGGPPVTAANPLQSARFSRLTNWPGAEFDAAISPDGRFVAFVADRDGEHQAYVGEIGTGEYRPVAPGVRGDATMAVRNVGFVQGGREIWLGGGLSAQGMKSVPLFGGAVQDLLEPDAVNAAWSPDGRRVVYHWGDRGDRLFTAEGRGVDPQPIQVPTEAGYHQHFPAWSSDGRWIYISRGWETSGEMDLWRMRPDGTSLVQLTEGKPRVRYPTPLLGDRTVLYVALDADGGGPWLWALDLATGDSQAAAIGPSHYSSVSASADGRRIVATVVDSKSSLWTVPILKRLATERDVKPYELPLARARAPRMRGSDLYFLSSRGSRNGLWRQRAGRVREIWKGSDGALLEPAAISPDGRHVVITVREKTRTGLWLIDAESGVRKPIGGPLVPRGAADWSPDGERIVVGGSVAGQNGLYAIDVDPARLERLVTGEALNPTWSPRGDLIVYAGEQTNAFTPLKAVQPQDKQAVALPAMQVVVGGERVRFLPDGSGFVYMLGADPGKQFHVFDLATKHSHPLTAIETSAKMSSFDVSPDGASILFDRLREDSDVVLIERGPR